MIDDTLGWALYRKGLYDMALRYLKESVAKAPNASGKYHLAMAFIPRWVIRAMLCKCWRML